jgi:hypothetical protein
LVLFFEHVLLLLHVFLVLFLQIYIWLGLRLFLFLYLMFFPLWIPTLILTLLLTSSILVTEKAGELTCCIFLMLGPDWCVYN